MKQIEKFYNYQEMSLMWTYLIDGELYFLALDASKFYISYSDVGEIDAIIVQSGSFLNSEKETLYHFKMWKNGTIYYQIAEDWGLISTDDAGWVVNEKNPTYDVLPFTIMQDDSVNMPSKSTLVDLENEAISGDSFTLMSILYSLIIKIVINTSNEGPMVQSLIDELGIINRGAVIDRDDVMSTMAQADTDNHMNYKAYVEKLIMFRGQTDGVDKYSLFPKDKIESGVAKRAEMGNINQMRSDRIVDWEEFEDQHWDLINFYDKKIGLPTDYIFAPLPNMIDITEQADIDQKEWATTQSKWQGGVLTAKQYVRKGNPEADDQEVDNLVNGLNGGSDEIEIDFDNEVDVDQD